MKKIITLALLLLVPFSLVGCSGGVDYEDVVGYWKSTTKNDFINGKPYCLYFEGNKFTPNRGNPTEFKIADGKDELTLIFPTQKNAEIYIKELKNDTLKVSLPTDINGNLKRVYHDYKKISKEEYEESITR